MAPSAKIVSVKNLALELLDLTQVRPLSITILRGYSLQVLILEYTIPIHLLGVSMHVSHVSKQSNTGIIILHFALSIISLLLYANITANF